MTAALKEANLGRAVARTGAAGLTDWEKMDGNYSPAGEADFLLSS